MAGLGIDMRRLFSHEPRKIYATPKVHQGGKCVNRIIGRRLGPVFHGVERPGDRSVAVVVAGAQDTPRASEVLCIADADSYAYPNQIAFTGSTS